jgi:hypothetical protein
VNDNDVGSSTMDAGLTAQTWLIAGIDDTSVFRVRNVSSAGGNGVLGEGSNSSANGDDAGRGVRGEGGSHTSGGASSDNDGGDGVQGDGGDTNGTSTSAFAGDGVFGVGGTSSTSVQRHGAGVRGRGSGLVGFIGPGVVGETFSSVHPAVAAINSGGGFGLLGTSGGVGLRGVSFGASSAGVEGVASGAGPGVWGFTSSGHAVLGNSTTGNGGVFVGVTGVTTTGTPNALVANGNVFCTGTGHFGGGLVTTTRSADGGLRATYGVTSPDALVEDVGRARLVNGQARVELDPAFTGLIQSSDYAVFLTPNGDCNGLYVAAKSTTGFDIRELRGGTSTLDVDFRVVGKRSGAQSAARLARVAEPPPVTIPAMQNVPSSPADIAWLTREDKPRRERERDPVASPTSPTSQPTPRR